MAGSIKGITIELGGDTTKLDKALQGVNAKSRDLQSELRQVDKLLKLDPSNVTLVAQKQKLLTEAVHNTSAKLETLKTAERQVQEQFKRGEVSEEQYRALQREIVATEQKLNGYQNELKEVGAESKKTANATEDIGNKANNTTPKMKGFSVGSVAAIAAISAAAVAAVAAIKGIADKVKESAFGMAEYADEVNTLAAKYKVSSGTIQEWMYIAKIADTEVEVMGGSLAKLVRAMNSAEKGTKDQVKAFKALGVEYKKSNGKFRDTEDVFYDLIDALGKMDDETQADIFANALFSRSFQDLNPLIAVGANGIKDLSEKAEELGLVLGQDQLDKLNGFQDAIDTLGAQVKIAAAPFVEGLIPAFEKVAAVITQKLGDPKTQAALGKIGEKLGDLAIKITDKLIAFLESDDFSTMADGLLKLGDSIAEGVIWLFDDALPWIVENRAEISDAMTLIGAAMLALGVATGNAQVALAGLISFAGPGLAAINAALTENKIALDGWAENNSLRLAEAEGFWGSFITNLMNDQLEVLDWYNNDAPDALRAWAEANGFYTGQVTGAFDFMKLQLLKIMYDIGSGIQSAWNGVTSFFTGIWASITQGFKNFVNGIVGGINSLIGAINRMISGINSVSSKIGIPAIGNIPPIPRWNAEGVIFDKPTILPTIAGLQGVGERGAEITAPLAKLQNLMINTAKETGGGKTVNITINTQSMTPAQETRLINRINYELGMA